LQQHRARFDAVTTKQSFHRVSSPFSAFRLALHLRIAGMVSLAIEGLIEGRVAP
jgi:hypothetical protein